MESMNNSSFSNASSGSSPENMSAELDFSNQVNKFNSLSNKKIPYLVAFLILACGLLVAVVLSQRNQDNRQQASENSLTITSNFRGNGRFGVAVATWDYSKLQCYHPNGVRVDCFSAPNQMNRRNFSDMRMTATDGSDQRLGLNAFNVSNFSALDPSANTQFIWFHYEGTGSTYEEGRSQEAEETTNGTLEISEGVFSYDGSTDFTVSQLGRPLRDEELTRDPITGVGAEIYATSGAPGSVRVIVQKENGATVPVDIGDNKIPKRGFGWRIRLPGIRYEDGYPYCTGGKNSSETCIFKQQEFADYLRANNNFNDNDPIGVLGASARSGNWYTFYLLAETEYGIVSHYLEPYEYAAVVNTYVREIKAINPRARFILGSPVIGSPDRYKPYYEELWNSPNMLSPLAKESITFIGADHFLPALPNPDVATGNYPAITEAQIQKIADEFVAVVRDAGQFFFQLTGKQTLLTQTGPLMHKPVHPEPDSLNFSFDTCGWCTNNTDVWRSVQYGTARLVQVTFGKLLDQVAETNVPAWAYWGGMQQEYWKDPLINKTWGGLNHGIHWLSWPLLCTTEKSCPVTTNEPWPSYIGTVYLKLANGDRSFVPDGAPEWWPRPVLQEPVLATPSPTPLILVSPSPQAVRAKVLNILRK